MLSEGELWISDTLTLIGEGMTTTIVDAQDNSRVFNIENLDDNILIDVTLSNITVENGHSTNGGGGIRTSENLSIQNSTIKENYSGDGGGGIYSRALSTIVLTNVQISNNTTSLGSAGGGVRNQAFKFTAFNCIFSNNFSGDEGGGISNQTNMTIINSIVEGNTADEGGGGISNSGSMTLTNSVVQFNTMIEDAFRSGGGIVNYEIITITNSIIQNNISMGKGGGLSNQTAEHVFIDSTFIRDNTATDDGGGIYNETSVGIHLQNSEVYSNSGVDGGGIHNDRSIMTITTSHFYSNTASSQGGGIYSIDVEALGSPNYVLIDSSIIKGNTAVGSGSGRTGGGLHINSGTMTITHSTISSNVANLGGGISSSFNNGWGKVFVLNSTISENFATNGGGGITIGASFIKLDNSTVSGNSSNNSGGGISVGEGTVILNHSTIVNNTADAEGNGYGDGGGLYTSEDGQYVFFRNTIVADNIAVHAPDCGGDESLNSLDYNLVEDPSDCSIIGTTSNNIIGLDPIVGALANNGGETLTHALLAGSPAINTGICTDIDGNPITVDQRGFARPYGDNCDIGAYEADGSEPTPTPSPTPIGKSAFFVNTTLDLHDALPGDGVCAGSNGDCSLRAAIEEANALPWTDMINLPDGMYLLSEGELIVTDAFTLTGNSATDTIIDAQLNSRVLYINDSLESNLIHLTLSNITIQGGSALEDYGGGIWNQEKLFLINSIVQENFAQYGGGISNQSNGTLIILDTNFFSNTVVSPGFMIPADGAGIYSSGTTTITNSTFSYNNGSVIKVSNTFITNSTFAYNDGIGMYLSGSALVQDCVITANNRGISISHGQVTIENTSIQYNSLGDGSGIFISGDTSQVVINRSLISHNIAMYGGRGAGIHQFSGQLTITNSTISNNQAESHGGGIFLFGGSTIIDNSTIVENTTLTGNGGGLYNNDDPFGKYLKNTILADNTVLGGEASDCGGYEITSQGYNLIEDLSGCTIGGITDNNIVGVDPLLASLMNNGGDTPTHALLPGSPAIDTGSCIDTNGYLIIEDQRGFPRPYGTTCDIGAYEADGSEPTPTPSSTVTPIPTITPTVTPSPTLPPPTPETKIYLPITIR